MLDIITIGDEVLRQKAEPIKDFSSELGILVDAMFDTLKIDDGVGLAAPQIGVSQRLFVVDIPDGEKKVFINPEIVETSQETVAFEEGCLSIPGIYTDVVRPKRVAVQARDINGKPFNMNVDGFLARVIQHEFDHLNGVLFIDRIPEERRERLMKTYYKRNKKK